MPPVLGAYRVQMGSGGVVEERRPGTYQEDNIGAYPLAPGVIQTEMMTNCEMPTAAEVEGRSSVRAEQLDERQERPSVTVPGYYPEDYKRRGCFLTGHHCLQGSLAVSNTRLTVSSAACSVIHELLISFSSSVCLSQVDV